MRLRFPYCVEDVPECNSEALTVRRATVRGFTGKVEVDPPALYGEPYSYPNRRSLLRELYSAATKRSFEWSNSALSDEEGNVALGLFYSTKLPEQAPSFDLEVLFGSRVLYPARAIPYGKKVTAQGSFCIR
eukprot:scaffold347788_cov40-Prasinocladus_malaysianus.AAC.1